MAAWGGCAGPPPATKSSGIASLQLRIRHRLPAAVLLGVPLKNKSEMLLEGYLRSQGYDAFDFEPEIAGTTRRPDYRLRVPGGEVLLEVKEFRGNADDFRGGFGYFDPYPPLREKLDTARDKFSKLN